MLTRILVRKSEYCAAETCPKRRLRADSFNTQLFVCIIRCYLFDTCSSTRELFIDVSDLLLRHTKHFHLRQSILHVSACARSWACLLGCVCVCQLHRLSIGFLHEDFFCCTSLHSANHPFCTKCTELKGNFECFLALFHAQMSQQQDFVCGCQLGVASDARVVETKSLCTRRCKPRMGHHQRHQSFEECSSTTHAERGVFFLLSTNVEAYFFVCGVTWQTIGGCPSLVVAHMFAIDHFHATGRVLAVCFLLNKTK